jgi:hypothetical protein
MTTLPSQVPDSSEPSAPVVRAPAATSSDVAPRPRPRNTHPLVVTIERKSAPRAVFSGDQLTSVDLPEGTRVDLPAAAASSRSRTRTPPSATR